MKKHLIFSLFFISSALFFSCSKDEEATPAASVEGEWSLKSIETDITALGQRQTHKEEYNEGYFNFGSDNKFQSNLAAGEDIVEEFLVLTTAYTSDFKVEGKRITLSVYDEAYETTIPYSFEIVNVTSNSLELKATKADILEAAKEMDKLDGSGTQNHDLLNAFIASAEIKINLAK